MSRQNNEMKHETCVFSLIATRPFSILYYPLEKPNIIVRDRFVKYEVPGSNDSKYF